MGDLKQGKFGSYLNAHFEPQGISPRQRREGKDWLNANHGNGAANSHPDNITQVKRAGASTVKSLKNHVVVYGVVLALMGAVLIWFYFAPHRPYRSYSNLLSASDASNWKFYGGGWSYIPSGVQNVTGQRGDKAIYGEKEWTDYSVESDIRFDTDPSGMHWGDSGIVFRVTDPAIGVDAYDGYYAGISYTDQQLFIGKADYGWNRMVAAHLTEPVHLAEWYHLKVTAKGCYIEAEVHPDGSSEITKASFYDEGCRQKFGAVGVRTFGVRASWKDFSVSQSR